MQVGGRSKKEISHDESLFMNLKAGRRNRLGEERKFVFGLRLSLVRRRVHLRMPRPQVSISGAFQTQCAVWLTGW